MTLTDKGLYCDIPVHIHLCLYIFMTIGVTVLVDNKALLSVLGSEMDYVEDKLSAQFVFNNPNVKESCGCGMSFMT
jgi:iron-sulfur cluster assembly accessory protein